MAADYPSAHHLSAPRRVLIVDDDGAVRQGQASAFRMHDIVALAVDACDCASDILKIDAFIDLLLLDHSVTCGALGAWVAQFRVIRPALTIIGQSGENRRSAFADAGIDLFLLKPWSIHELLKMYADEQSVEP